MRMVRVKGKVKVLQDHERLEDEGFRNPVEDCEGFAPMDKVRVGLEKAMISRMTPQFYPSALPRCLQGTYSDDYRCISAVSWGYIPGRGQVLNVVLSDGETHRYQQIGRLYRRIN